MIFWYFNKTCDKDSDEPAQACILNTALMAQVCQASDRFYVGLTLCLTTQTTTWKKALLYKSLYKQTYLAHLLSCLTLWFVWLFLSNIINVQF